MPYIPEYLSNDAKSFVKLCLNRDPAARPTAQQLLDHPFIRDQSATRAANVNITRDAFPYMFDGSRTPVKSWTNFYYMELFCSDFLSTNSNYWEYSYYNSHKACSILINLTWCISLGFWMTCSFNVIQHQIKCLVIAHNCWQSMRQIIIFMLRNYITMLICQDIILLFFRFLAMFTMHADILCGPTHMYLFCFKIEIRE